MVEGFVFGCLERVEMTAAVVISWKKVGRCLWLRNESLLHVEELEFLGFLRANLSPMHWINTCQDSKFFFF